MEKLVRQDITGEMKLKNEMTSDANVWHAPLHSWRHFPPLSLIAIWLLFIHRQLFVRIECPADMFHTYALK